MNVRKIVRRTLLGLAIVVVLAAGAFVWMMGPRNVIGMLRYDQRREATSRSAAALRTSRSWRSTAGRPFASATRSARSRS